jgi:hypothetical protein
MVRLSKHDRNLVLLQITALFPYFGHRIGSVVRWRKWDSSRLVDLSLNYDRPRVAFLGTPKLGNYLSGSFVQWNPWSLG